LNTNVDTSDLIRVDPPAMQVLPPLANPTKSPTYIAQFPIPSTIGADTAKNFAVNGIPSYRIAPPIPLTLSGAGVNAVPTVTVAPILRNPTPAPTIASPLVSTPTGYSFSFNEVRLPLGDNFTISTYKIYRSTANVSATATVVDTIPHNPTLISTPVVVQDAQPNGSNFFYWVSAINSRGAESSPTAAQSGLVPNTSIANANSQLASSLKGVANNTTFVSTSSTTLSNIGLNTNVTISADVVNFGAGSVGYNSGTAGSLGFGPTPVVAVDSTMSGGAVPYIAGFLFSAQVSDAYLYWGNINTIASGGLTTGGGTTGGTTNVGGAITNSGAGGRGLNVL
jgi:hypothetical protein